MMHQDGVCGCCATTFKTYLATLRTPRAPGRLELIDRLRAQIRADAAPAEIRRQPVRSMPPERTICAETAGIVPASAACGDAMAPDTPASNAPISPKKRSFARSQGNRGSPPGEIRTRSTRKPPTAQGISAPIVCLTDARSGRSVSGAARSPLSRDNGLRGRSQGSTKRTVQLNGGLICRLRLRSRRSRQAGVAVEVR